MCIAIMHLPLGSPNSVSRPPLGPSNLVRASPRTPSRAPKGPTHAPKSSRDAPQGSQGPLGSPEMSKVDHQIRWKYRHLASREQEKPSFCIFARVLNPSQALPSSCARPLEPSDATKGPPQALPGPRKMLLGPPQARLQRVCKNHFKKVSIRPPQAPSQAPLRTPTYRKVLPKHTKI